MSGPTTRELIIRGAREHADRVAVVVGDEERTFAQVDTLSNQLAHAFASVGGGHHARVGLLVNNGLLSVPVDMACVKAGINRIPLNSRLSVDEHARMLRETHCDLVIYGADLANRAAELAALLPEVRFHGLETGSDWSAALMDIAASMPSTLPEVPVEPDDIILTLFTSGTTGTLKAAQHTQSSYAGICRNVLLNLIPVQPDDVMLHAASLIHASGVFVLPFWLRGAKTVILPGFEPGAFLTAITRYRVTVINLVPTMIQMLTEHPDFETTEVSELRRVIYGASPMPRPTIERAMDVWGRERFWQYYGQTEIPLTIAVLRPEDHVGERLGACGQISADIELRLIDDEGSDVAPGSPGEIVVRGPSAVAGYYDAPELTEQTFRDGWVHTRDVGMLDEHGFLYLKDRTSDMIISGGYNVYPREVEDVLLEHPAVREVAVVGTPDPTWVEVVTAVIVVGPEVVADEALITELTAHVGTRLAGYKKPRRVIFTDAIPKTAVGKLDRRTLRGALART
ncbi:AMP-binding protein [Gordonia sp. PP30]|uniref:class I adenylate-forming enzyme family protein n=1 Tax=unclassified Gordonia (in: high G+C Gram-positive bacteria) TaxID=2657482 RepID=UPI001FFF1127|nr:AMP-binding protein [Gordonia sp. PP30]UQE73425.1 AMP-binding protein [Gordonia sp. PP30]